MIHGVLVGVQEEEIMLMILGVPMGVQEEEMLLVILGDLMVQEEKMMLVILGDLMVRKEEMVQKGVMVILRMKGFLAKYFLDQQKEMMLVDPAWT